MIEIIDNFHIGSDIPLDARYAVDTIYDVSMYWFNGLQMYDASTGRAWVVRDVSLSQVEEIILDYDILSGGLTWDSSSYTDIYDGGIWPLPGGWEFIPSQIVELAD